MTEFVSIREYARRRGVSHTSVIKAAKSGRITLTNGKVDPKAADLDWSRNTDEAQRRTAPHPANGQSTPDAGAPPGLGLGPEGVTYAKSRAVRETFLARLAALDYDVKKGKLVSVDDVRARVFNTARTARDMLLGLPDRLAPRLTGETNQFEVHRILSEEVARICNEIANARIV